MYQEIKLINQVDDKQDRLNIALLFLEEYAGWKHHLENVGLTWGVDGEEVGAAKEMAKVQLHIEKLKELVVSECLL